MRSALALLLLLGACTPMRMPVPGPLASAPEWEVHFHGWGSDRLSFGPFEVHDLERNARERGGILDAISGKREFQQEYEFLLRDTAAATDLWKVRCDNRDVERGVGIGGVQVTLDERTALECTLNPPDDPSAPWTLRLASRRERLPAGDLRRELESRYEIRAQTASGEGCCDVAGYVVRGGGTFVAAVERGDRGTVRLGESLAPEERPLLAAVAAALLIRTELIRQR